MSGVSSIQGKLSHGYPEKVRPTISQDASPTPPQQAFTTSSNALHLLPLATKDHKIRPARSSHPTYPPPLSDSAPSSETRSGQRLLELRQHDEYLRPPLNHACHSPPATVASPAGLGLSMASCPGRPTDDFLCDPTTYGSPLVQHLVPTALGNKTYH
jgi:hypothetical protein